MYFDWREAFVSAPDDEASEYRAEPTLPLHWIAALLIGPAAAIAIAVQSARISGRNWGVLLADPAERFDFPVLAGIFSHAGVLLLVGCAAICFFSRTLLAASGRADRAAAVLGLVGLLSAILALDDLFLLHERVLRHVLGIPEASVYAVYGLIGLATLWKLGSGLLRPSFLGLWLAVGLLGIMVTLDQLQKVIGTPALLLLAEDTAKLCGFALWAGFWIAYARASLAKDAVA